MRPNQCSRCQGSMFLHSDPERDEHQCPLTFWKCVNCAYTVWIRPSIAEATLTPKRASSPCIVVFKSSNGMGGWKGAVKFHYPMVKKC